jgi:hypothetical protein
MATKPQLFAVVLAVAIAAHSAAPAHADEIGVTLGALSDWGRSSFSGFRVAWTVGPLVVGSLNLGLSLYSSHRQGRDSAPTRISLVPIMGADKQGGLFGGVGVRVAAF